MPTVVKTFRFDSDLEGLEEAGLSLTSIGYYAGDGDPSNGCCRIQLSGGGFAAVAKYARKPGTTDSWETWGVPPGATVQTVECARAQGKQAGTGAITALLYARVVDATAGSVHGSGTAHDLIAANIAPDIGGPAGTWFDLGTNGVQAVDSGRAASTQSVRLEIQADVGLVTGSCDFRLDTIVLHIVYTGGSSGGDPGGGDTGGDGGTGDTGDTGDDTSVTTGGGVYPEADCVLPTGPDIYGPLAAGQQYATAGFWQNRLYLSYGGRTFALDVQTGGWSNTGYGHIRQFLPVSVPQADEWLFMIAATLDPEEGYIGADNYVAFTSPMVRPGQPGAVNLAATRQVVLGPFDGVAADRESVKRAVRLRVWGEYDNPGSAPATTIGTVKMMSDTGYTETYPILPLARQGFDGPNPPRIYRPGLLFEQSFRTAMRGRGLWALCTFTEPCVTVRDAMLEYVRLHGER